MTARQAALGLIVIAAFSTVLRIAVVRSMHAPIIFSDELGYEKLAQSIGRTGHLALFNDPGLSYAPLYPAVLSPIYALGATAPTAYTLIKIVNALLISLAVFPTYMIARYALPRRSSVLVTVLATAAPLMAFSSYVMSENLAYPVALMAFWAMLAAIRAPGIRGDALLLAALLAATAARTQLVVLVPAALTAVLLSGAAEREPESLARRLLGTVSRHRLLFGAVAAGLLVSGAGALAGKGVFSIFGRYAIVGRVGLPNFWHFVYVLAQHVAGVDLAVGVVPFVGAIVVGVAFARAGFRGAALPFAAVAVSATVWLLLEVAFDASLFDNPRGDLPRVHERFLIYVVPFFLIALFAALRIPAAKTPGRSYFAAAGIAALLPVAIPFHTVVNGTTIVDTFSLQPFAFSRGRGELEVVPDARLVAVCVAAFLGLLYVALRRRERGVVLLVLLPLVFISVLLLPRISKASDVARTYLPARTDWVDAAKPEGTVVLISGARHRASAAETAFSNLSIDRLYYLCRAVAGPEFGEQQATIDASGRVRQLSGPIEAAYVVAPANLGISGRIVARNRKGSQVLVAPTNGRLSVPPSLRAADLKCPPARAGG